jgi:hypothetical protein
MHGRRLSRSNKQQILLPGQSENYVSTISMTTKRSYNMFPESRGTTCAIFLTRISHKVFKFVRTLKKDAPQKNYHFVYAKEEVFLHVNTTDSFLQDSFKLSGYSHNAITPIGTTTTIPLILSHKIQKLSTQLSGLVVARSI